MVKKQTPSINYSFFLLSFLIVTIFKNIGIVLVILVLLYFLVKRLVSNGTTFTIKEEDRNIIILFYLIPYASLAISIVSIFICGVSYVEFYPSRMGRMFNMSIYFSIFIFLVNLINKHKISASDATRYYLYGCYILLFFGIWQLLNNTFNVPYFEFKTRIKIHSMDTTLLFPFMNIRVTSIAEEPAYLIPYLMDAAIILFYMPFQMNNNRNRSFLLLLLVVILFFTLSLSGYMNFFIICAFVFFFSRGIKKVVGLIFLCPILLYVFYKLQAIFLAIFARLDFDILLKSGRLQESILPINYMFSQASLFNLLFGFGPKGLVYICNFIFYTDGYRKGEMVDAESHVIFVDHFIEYGLLGLIITIILFCYLYILAKKTYFITQNRFSQVLCLNLMITSLYTSDYASPRFTVIILLILFSYKNARELIHEKNCTY